MSLPIEYTAETPTLARYNGWSRLRAASTAAVAIMTLSGLASCTSDKHPTRQETSASTISLAPVAKDPVYPDCTKWAHAPIDTKITLAASLRSIVQENITGSFSPSAAVAVGCGNHEIAAFGDGTTDGSRKVAQEANAETTSYGVASVTKLVTTIGIMMLADRGKLGPLGLDTTIGTFVPAYRVNNKQQGDKAADTFRMELQQRGGLPDASYASVAGDPAHPLPSETVQKNIINYPLKYAPDKGFIYSNIGTNVAYFAAGIAAGQSLNSYIEQNLFAPLGMRHSGTYHDNNDPKHHLAGAQHLTCAPNSPDDDLRRLLWDCRDQDRLVRSLGGAAGNAGDEFSARDLGKVTAMLANGGQLNGKRFVNPSDITLMSTLQTGADPNEPYGTGARLNTLGLYGTWLSPNTYGHTGFSGSELSVDPERGLWVVMLNNGMFHRGTPGKLGYQAYQLLTKQFVDATNQLP